MLGPAVSWEQFDRDTAAQITADKLRVWCHAPGFQPQIRVTHAKYSWTVARYCYLRDCAVTARLGSIATTRVKPMLALAKRDISINARDVAKLRGRVDKKVNWHKSAGLECIYMDIGRLQHMRASDKSVTLPAKEAASTSVKTVNLFFLSVIG